MIRAYLYALDPADVQLDAMRSHCGAQRVAYNWCLARVRANWAQRAAEQTYGLTGDDLTPWVNTSAYSLRKAWNAGKKQVAPWWADNSKEAYASGCANLATALGNRKAGRAWMPRFKSKHRSRPTCRFTTGSCGLSADRRHIRLPVIGTIRTAESTRKLARKVEAGAARIRSATLSFQRGRWHVAFSVEVDEPVPAPHDGGRVVGVDLGIKDLAVLSTGEHVANARRLDAALRDLRRTQRRCWRRRGPDRRTCVEPSQRWRKARTRADAIHTRVANLRRNDTHQLTTRLVRDFATIVIEDLHVAGMLRNRRLARHIAGANWAEIRRQLTDKTERAGCAPARGGPLVRQLEDLLGMRYSESQADAFPAQLRLLGVRPRPRPGPQRRAQPGRSGGRHRRVAPGAARQNRCQTGAACCGGSWIAAGRPRQRSTPPPQGGRSMRTFRHTSSNGRKDWFVTTERGRPR